MCTKKKRYADKDLLASRMGLTVFQRFYQLTTTSKKVKTVEDFIDSSYYLDFVKFARYLAELNPVNREAFVDFVIKNGVKLKDWTKEFVYETYLQELMKKEPPEKALERTVLLMVEWAEANGKEYKDFFREISVNEAFFFVKNGRISPWVLYLADSASTVMEQFNEEQYKMIENLIDPTFWNHKIRSNKEDSQFILETLDRAGL